MAIPRDLKLIIAMATKNGAVFLDEQLRSLSKLENCEFEVLVVDSNSSDDTRLILKDWSKFLKIRIVNKNFLSSSESFAWLLSEIPENSYVAFSDQDDIWHPDKISKLLDLGESNQPTLYCSSRRYIDSVGNYTGKRSARLSTKDFSIANALVENLVFGNTILINPTGVKLAQEHLLAPRKHWDWHLYLIFILMGHIRYLDQPTVNYRLHDSNEIGIRRFLGVKQVISEVIFKLSESEKIFNKLKKELPSAITFKISNHFETIQSGRFLDVMNYLRNPFFKRTNKIDHFILLFVILIIWLRNHFLNLKDNFRSH
jgi:glycosyltransferase involved in cell wall biosynthesis